MFKKKFLQKLFFGSALIFSSARVAAGPIQYTWEVGLPGLSSSDITSFGSFILLIIRWSYWLAILFAFFKLIELGFKYMTSKGNVNVVAFAAKSFKDILIGLLILFGTFLILNTINPELTLLPNRPHFSDQEEFASQNFTCTVKIEDLKKKAQKRAEFISRLVGWMTGAYTSIPGALIHEWLTDKISDKVGESFDEDLIKGNLIQGSYLSDLAAKDIKNGEASKNIQDLYAALLKNPAEWLGEDCYHRIDVGPIKNGHLSQSSSYEGGYKCPDGSHRSCHQLGMAVDVTAFDKDKKISKECTKKVIKWFNTYSKNHLFRILDETNISGVEPHIHIEERKCESIICK